MSEFVVRVENLGKQYFLGRQRSGDLRQAFVNAVRRLSGKEGSAESFWALKDLNFEIRRGEVVGIAGRNGAGKSTLLKILSRITHPTTGRFEIIGRVSSLLEVGTGFHMELTGRENIFLNGTILGMRRSEIRSRFDEIVAFSGVEGFLDTPVKHYSSGMRVRLAFSIAAHLEPEILIIDEVLAVGDAEFQRKCVGKMDEVSKREGRTILFVSHNMAAVEHLCNTAMLLGEGQIVLRGSVDSVVRKYLETCDSIPVERITKMTKGLSVTRFTIDERVDCLDDVNYEITLSSDRPNRVSELAILVYNDLQERIGIIDLRHDDLVSASLRKQEITIRGCIRSIPLIEGNYQLGLFVSSDLFRGDILDVKRLVVNSRISPFVPYARKHRGYLEFETDFKVA